MEKAYLSEKSTSSCEKSELRQNLTFKIWTKTAKRSIGVVILTNAKIWEYEYLPLKSFDLYLIYLQGWQWGLSYQQQDSNLGF